MSKRSLEPIGTYDPYHPRVFGTADETVKARHKRELAGVIVTNEAFASQKQREIAAKTRAVAESDADAIMRASIEAWCAAAPKSRI